MKLLPLPEGKFAKVDDSDFEWLGKRKWSLVKNPSITDTIYVRDSKTSERMHRLIMNPLKGLDIDHINRDGLDNQRKNLRIVTHAQNLYKRKVNKNTYSGYRGAYILPNGKYQARVKSKNKTYSFGCYKTPQEAGIAAQNGRIKIFGESNLVFAP